MEIKKINIGTIGLINLILESAFNPCYNKDNFDWLLAEPPYAGSVAYETAIKELRKAGIGLTYEVKEEVERVLGTIQDRYFKIRKMVKEKLDNDVR